MKEIEILYRLKSNIEEVKEKVRYVMGEYKIAHVIDVYYARDDIQDLSPNESDRLYASLRVRYKQNKSYITYKNDHFNEKDEWIYSDEYETEITHGKVIEYILEKTFFKKLVIIDNTKYIFENYEYEIVIEDVKNLGVFLEIEYRGNKNYETYDEIQRKKIEMRQLIESMGIKIECEENAGKPELMLKKEKILVC